MKKIVFLFLIILLFSFKCSHSKNYKECLKECEEICEVTSKVNPNLRKGKCKNTCPFCCKCVQTCFSDDCEKSCYSYLDCKITCPGEPNFCKRVCEPDLNWIFLSFDDKENAHFYHVESVEQNIFDQKIVKVWEKIIFSNKGKQDYIKELVKFNPEHKKIDYNITLWEIICAEKKVRMLEVTDYALDGSIIESVNFFELTEWHYFAPGTTGREFLEKVCWEVRLNESLEKIRKKFEEFQKRSFEKSM